VIIYA